VLEQSGEAVIVKDLNAVVTYWNREAAALYGFSAEEAIGQPLRKLHAAELSEDDYSRLLERVRAGHPTSSMTERRKRGGEIIRVTLKTTPLLDEQGILVGEITIARDVTEMYQKEAALRTAEEALQVRMTNTSPTGVAGGPPSRRWRRTNAGLCGSTVRISSGGRELFGADMRMLRPRATSACPSTDKGRSSACSTLRWK
jgi:PAS domain S-box-containing protein